MNTFNRIYNGLTLPRVNERLIVNRIVSHVSLSRDREEGKGEKSEESRKDRDRDGDGERWSSLVSGAVGKKDNLLAV